MAYDFHYTPTGTGVISGKEVLEQTEDAINDLGNTAISGVQEALDKAEQALTNSENAVDDAQTALNTANNAEGVAIQAQTDVSNLSGTVTNIGNRVTTAEGNISNLQGRMTTAEGNITNLQGRMTTAEGNIGNLQTAVSTAQATANSAQQTATTARQQSYVFRYSSTALTPSSTNANSLLDNTDNLKVGDKVIDSSGVLFSVTAIDTQNSTFTIGTSLIDLAQDSDVVHKSGNETVGGSKTFSATPTIYNSDVNESTPDLYLQNQLSEKGNTANPNSQRIVFTDKNTKRLSQIQVNKGSSGETSLNLRVETTDNSNNDINSQINYYITKTGTKNFVPNADNDINLGSSSLKWKNIYSTNYYYGSNNVEFSNKFVTTDTAQTISGGKTFSVTPYIYNSDNTGNTPNITLRSSKSAMGTSDTDSQGIFFNDKNNDTLASLRILNYTLNGSTYLTHTVNTKDTNNQNISASLSFYILNNGRKVFRSDVDNDVLLGYSSNRWKDFYTYLINGLEPSSLSLPSGNVSDVIDISSYITALDGTSNSYTVPANGWISIAITGTAIAIVSSSWSDSRLRASSGDVRMLYPVLKNETLGISVIGTTLAYARFIPCQGNV